MRARSAGHGFGTPARRFLRTGPRSEPRCSSSTLIGTPEGCRCSCSERVVSYGGEGPSGGRFYRSVPATTAAATPQTATTRDRGGDSCAGDDRAGDEAPRPEPGLRSASVVRAQGKSAAPSAATRAAIGQQRLVAQRVSQGEGDRLHRVRAGRHRAIRGERRLRAAGHRPCRRRARPTARRRRPWRRDA